MKIQFTHKRKSFFVPSIRYISSWQIFIFTRKKFLFFYNFSFFNLYFHIHMHIKKKVSDVNDDVRRAAVTGIGFLLFRWVKNAFFILYYCYCWSSQILLIRCYFILFFEYLCRIPEDLLLPISTSIFRLPFLLIIHFTFLFCGWKTSSFFSPHS